jgi:thioredoxin 1
MIIINARRFFMLSAAIILAGTADHASGQEKALPTFLDLGSKVCIPCKLMAPILDSLGKEFKGSLNVRFVEVGMGGDKTLAEKHKITSIPTQIFLDPDGKELWRHEGYISRYGILDKWREFGYAFASKALAYSYTRMEPPGTDKRPKETICSMCDGDIPAMTAVTVKTANGDVHLCGPHCYFIMFSCLLEDMNGFDIKVSVTDYYTGKPVPAVQAFYLYGHDEHSGRPWIKAFTRKEDAAKERALSGGNVISWNILKKSELAVRCGFCDRAVYPEDAAVVRADGLFTWGCCSHCALGVAVRTGKDIEVIQPDRLTGKPVTVKTFNGYVENVSPAGSVAWFGLKKTADGKFISAGCFHQGFFESVNNLKAWVAKNPAAVGRMISIDEALGDKMKLSVAQIKKACKIGECGPK